MKFTLEQVEIADRLVRLIEHTFFHAYYSHANGMAEDELLIAYDIEAAGFGVDDTIAETCRVTIKAAVTAVDKRVPYFEAHQYLADKIKARVHRMIKTQHYCAALPQSFVRASIAHALDKD